MTARIFLTCLVLAAVLHSPPRAAAQTDPAALAAAEDLVTLMSAGMLEQMSDQMVSALQTQLELALDTRLDDATIAAVHQEAKAILMVILADSMKAAPPIYARHFTAAELGDIAAFYRTPTGQKTIRVLPAVTGEAMQSMAPQIMAAQKLMLERVTAILRERGKIQ